ncbi:MAG: molybdenum cofactor guanylyltransferase [Nitrospirae bacterium]|nr:molybdenum cofactor guanylyltransferase [Nitrospirota bacterium]
MSCEIIGAVLAGGENSRFPKLKGFIEISGSTIISRNISILREVCGEVMISTNMPEAYLYLGEKMIGDVLKSRGPMSGIHACLLNADGEGVFVAACDMPFIKKELIELVLDEYRKERPVAAIPLWDEKPEPLLGIYRKELIPLFEKAIFDSQTSIADFLKGIDAYFIPANTIRKEDATGRSFVNINTIEDFEKNIGVSFYLNS